MTTQRAVLGGMYTHILWDWDGCLAKTLHLWVENYTYTFHEEGIAKTREEIVASMGHFRRDIQRWGYSLERANYLVKKTHTRATPQLTNVGLYPYAKETVIALHEYGAKQAIVTKSPQHIVRAATRHHGIDHILRVVIGGDSVPEQKQKPHREPVDRALQLLGGDFGNILIVGDSSTDLRTAQNANIDAALYYPSENEEFYDLEELKKDKPLHIVKDLREILTLTAR